MLNSTKILDKYFGMIKQTLKTVPLLKRIGMLFDIVQFLLHIRKNSGYIGASKYKIKQNEFSNQLHK